MITVSNSLKSTYLHCNPHAKLCHAVGCVACCSRLLVECPSLPVRSHRGLSLIYEAKLGGVLPPLHPLQVQEGLSGT